MTTNADELVYRPTLLIHGLTSNFLCVVWTTPLSYTKQISSLESFSQAAEYFQSFVGSAVGRSYRVTGHGSSCWGHQKVAEWAVNGSASVFLKGLKRQESGTDTD